MAYRLGIVLFALGCIAAVLCLLGAAVVGVFGFWLAFTGEVTIIEVLGTVLILALGAIFIAVVFFVVGCAACYVLAGDKTPIWHSSWSWLFIARESTGNGEPARAEY